MPAVQRNISGLWLVWCLHHMALICNLWIII